MPPEYSRKWYGKARLSPPECTGHRCWEGMLPPREHGRFLSPCSLFRRMVVWSVWQSVLNLNIPLWKPNHCSERHLFLFCFILSLRTWLASLGLLWICRLQAETMGIRRRVWTTFCCTIRILDVKIHWGIMSKPHGDTVLGSGSSQSRVYSQMPSGNLVSIFVCCSVLTWMDRNPSLGCQTWSGRPVPHVIEVCCCPFTLRTRRLLV